MRISTLASSDWAEPGIDRETGVFVLMSKEEGCLWRSAEPLEAILH